MREVNRNQIDYYNASNEIGEEYVEVTVQLPNECAEFSQWGHIESEEELAELLEENGYKVKVD